MMRRTVELREEEFARFPRAILPDTDVLALRASGRFEIEPASVFNDHMVGLRSRGWIGHIPVGNDLLVRVNPKVPVSNLFGMLEIAYNLRSFQLFDGDIQVNSLEDLYERIVSILSRRVLDRARKGLYRDYFSETDELPYVRGRLDVVGAMLNARRGTPAIPCAYEEHTVDLDENRILLWTLHSVRRQALQREGVRIDLDRARRALGGTVRLKKFGPDDCINRLYHRLNSDYAPMHGLCRFVLEQAGPDIQPGDRAFVPFELNMPGLFEAFLAEWLRTNAPSSLTVRRQYNAQLDANFKVNIHVDIVLSDRQSNHPVAVLDSKYKADEQPSEGDIYQVAFYARELHVKRAFLVYPFPPTIPLRMVHGKEVRVESLAFDLGKPLDIAGPAFLERLADRLSPE